MRHVRLRSLFYTSVAFACVQTPLSGAIPAEKDAATLFPSPSSGPVHDQDDQEKEGLDSVDSVDHSHSVDSVDSVDPADPADEPPPHTSEQEPEGGRDSEEQTGPKKKDPPATVGYGAKGVRIETTDGKFQTNIQWRAQLRYSYPFDADLDEPDDYQGLESSTFRISRARLKVGGHAFQPWLKYFMEYDLRNNRLLTLRMTLEKVSWFRFRVGQFKVPYNRERVDSSAKQQFADRSIANRVFTFDRQPGAQVFGRIMPGTRGDSWYWGGVFTGTGRGSSANDDGKMLWVGRYQWNFLGRDAPFTQTDVEHTEKPAGSFAFAAATNRSQFTRFSSSGGGQLPGFEDGLPGQYTLKQWMGEAVFKYRGFSFQHEYHWKRIDDEIKKTRTDLRGAYAQAGYFLHYWIAPIPKPLEAIARFAFVDSNDAVSDDVFRALSLGINWFFIGHRNKLTFDVTRMSLQQRGLSDLSDVRFRLQWDVSF